MSDHGDSDARRSESTSSLSRIPSLCDDGQNLDLVIDDGQNLDLVMVVKNSFLEFGVAHDAHKYVRGRSQSDDLTRFSLAELDDFKPFHVKQLLKRTSANTKLWKQLNFKKKSTQFELYKKWFGDDGHFIRTQPTHCDIGRRHFVKDLAKDTFVQWWIPLRITLWLTSKKREPKLSEEDRREKCGLMNWEPFLTRKLSSKELCEFLHDSDGDLCLEPFDMAQKLCHEYLQENAASCTRRTRGGEKKTKASNLARTNLQID